MIFLWVIIFIIVHMSVFWLFYRKLQNPSVIDVGWASVLTLSGWLYLIFGNISFITITSGILLLLWGLRLGGYLWLSRVRKGHQDKRYAKLSEDWKMAKSLGFFLNFQLQGLLALFVSASFYFISQRISFSWLDGLWALLAITGLIGETIADYQLQDYKRQPTGSLCNIGLWRYSRHPNYFFDWLTWLSFSLIAFPSPWGWLALISPLTLYIIMAYITGPMTEAASLESRGDAYAKYQQQTNMFFPGPVQ